MASTLPLATDEIKKLHGKRFFLKLDAMHAFWAIPLCEEYKKLMAFQTHEGVFAWSRLTMDCRPASQIQQTAYHNAMDKLMPAQYRHCIAMFADDMAAGADSLEELFEISKALVTALDKSGIQVKPFKCVEKHLEILKGCFPLATPCQALGSQQIFLLMTDQA